MRPLTFETIEMNRDIQGFRRDFVKGALNIEVTPESPIQLFEEWLKTAIEEQVLDANAFNLSTVSPEGFPSSRIVLLKNITQEGLMFFTNFSSKKGKDMEKNPHVAANFFWAQLERQVRIEGSVSKLSEEAANEYFHSRPRESQLAAFTSAQSQEVENRETLEARFQENKARFEGKEIPKPTHWGGYKISPQYFEFWQGRAGRLHDRIVYELTDNRWVKSRIQP